MEKKAQSHNPGTDFLTGAVLGVDGVTMETWRAGLAVCPCGVVHAAPAHACQRVAVAEQHIGIGVAVALTWLARAADHHGVAIETWSTPGGSKRQRLCTATVISSHTRSCIVICNNALLYTVMHYHKLSYTVICGHT